MNRILLALTMVGFLLPLAPPAQADTEVSLNLFYDNLSPYGNWIEAGDYGYCFQPDVAVGNADWRPYSDGYWAYTDAGWTWVSYEDFGWATYHYGRWANMEDYGWVWVPGYDWGPAWVSWRTGGDYVGWAPLPPQPVGVVYEGQAITGAVDFTFGIGPLYYNFVDIRYIGEPVLRHRIYAPSRNVTIINHTVNVTNITYNNSRVYNYGPDYNRLNQYSTRPIQHLRLERELAVGAKFGESGRRGNFNRVNGNQLMVVAPQIEKSRRPIAPKQVKAKVDRPKVEHGWQGVANRQQVEAEMKKESRKNVPPPGLKPVKGRKREAVAASDSTGGNAGNAGNAVSAGDAGVAGRGVRGGQKEKQRQQQQAEKAQQTEPVEQARRAKEAQQAKRAEQAQKTQEAQRAEQARRAQEAQQVKRAEQAEEAKRADQARRVQEAQRIQQAPPPNRAQRPQQARQPSAPQNQKPNAIAKGKKNKPVDEPTPP